MRLIATHVDDTFALLRCKLEQEKAKPHRAIDPYFYRSHLVHEQELEHLIFKSWIYALHASEISKSGDKWSAHTKPASPAPIIAIFFFIKFHTDLA